MGAAASSSVRLAQQPEAIGEFRKHESSTGQYAIPEVPEKRQATDFKFTVVFGICIVFLLPFLIYTFVNSNLNRVGHGFDMCGNICGQNNSHIDGIPCSGIDKTKLPLLKYRDASPPTPGMSFEIDEFQNEDRLWKYDCVESCDSSDYTIVMNRCFPGADHESEALFTEIAADINKSAGYIVLLCFIGFGLSVGMLFLFRYFVAVVVWVILVGSVTGIVIITGVLWYLYSNSTSQDTQLRYVAIILTVVSIALVVMLICMFKRIKLVIRLFREAIKVIFGIPLILFEPLVTLLASSILLLIFVFFWFIFITAGNLEKVGSDLYDYVPNGVMLFTMFYHCIIVLWMSQFIIGCQHMVISGAVSAYYFARDKATLSSPIYNSFYNLIKYHMGTVAFGSLIITIVALIKALLRSLANSRHGKILVDCCIGAIEDALKFLSKNAYIQTAMHGQPFWKSGKRAVRLLTSNAISTIAVNSVGDFVLCMAKLLIVVCTVAIGTLMADTSIKHYWAAVAISALVTMVIADCFFTVFETAVDTIFLCFCEDSCMNDGMERPYYMTTEFMQYMEEAKKTIKDKDRQ